MSAAVRRADDSVFVNVTLPPMAMFAVNGKAVRVRRSAIMCAGHEDDKYVIRAHIGGPHVYVITIVNEKEIEAAERTIAEYL